MKFIHSYIPNNFNVDKKYTHVIWKEVLYSQLLSVLMIKRNHGDIKLYTNEFVMEQILKIGIPYDEIDVDVLDGLTPKTFSVVKMKVFESMNEPFIHIDTDTIINKKITFPSELDIMFAHRDFPDLGRTTTPKGFNDYFINAMNSYGIPFNDMKKSHSEEKINNFKVGEIPNMNLIYVKDFELFKKAAQLSLSHYEENKEKIDSYDKGYGACYIEQLMIHLNLMELSDKYKKSIESGESFLADKWFFQILQERKEGTYLENDFEFPLLFQNNYHYNKEFTCDCCGMSNLKNNKYTIKDENDMLRYFNHDFGGILHLAHHKWSPIIQCLIIGQIAHRFGVEWLRKVNSYYKDIYPKYNINLPLLSPGEKLYEKITGFQFHDKGMI
jgi:hypothetical protein